MARPKFSHAYYLGVEIESNREDVKDVTISMMREALARRMANLEKNDEWRDAFGAPLDTQPLEV